MTSYGYIIMVIVDSCMIWFHFDCIMQLKKSYHIATNVCTRKSATTFGDLPDFLTARYGFHVMWDANLFNGNQLVCYGLSWIFNLNRQFRMKQKDKI